MPLYHECLHVKQMLKLQFTLQLCVQQADILSNIAGAPEH